MFFLIYCPEAPHAPEPILAGLSAVKVLAASSVKRVSPAVSEDQIVNPESNLVEVTGGTKSVK